MCETLQRPAKGVLPKLVELGCLRYDTINHRYYYSARAEMYFDKFKRGKCAERITMTTETITDPIVITEQTNINGRDLSKFSDTELYGIIHEQELKLAELDAIKRKPKSLLAEIERRQAGIDALVAYMDAKFDAKNK